MTPSTRIPLPPGMVQPCDGRAARRLRGYLCVCQCGKVVGADPISGAPLRHEAPIVEAFTTGIGWRQVGRGLAALRAARGRYSEVRIRRVAR